MDRPASTSLPRAHKRSAPSSSTHATDATSTGNPSSTSGPSPSAAKRSRTVHFAGANQHDDFGPQLPTSQPALDPMVTDLAANSHNDDRDLPMDPRWIEAQARAPAQPDLDDDDDDEDGSGDDEDPELHILSGARRGARKRDRFEADRSGDEDSEVDDEDDEDDEDEDMFGEGGKTKKSKAKRKRVIQPLSYEDRKAQFHGKVGQFMDADDDNGGIELEPFNMRDEMRQGGFDESGTFIRKQDANARYDNWLAGLTDADMESAAMAQEAREQERQAHEHAVESRIAQFGSQPHQLVMALCGVLLPRETPSMCLGRLNARIERGPPKRGKAKHKSKSRSPGGEVEAEWREPLTSQWARQDVALVTDLADHLLNVCGMTDIYETDREELVADLRDDGHVPRQWAGVHPLASERKVEWSYSWIPADANVGLEESGGAVVTQETYGPFEAHEMKGWAGQGFFANGIEAQRFVNGVPVGGRVLVNGDVANDFKWEAPSG